MENMKIDSEKMKLEHEAISLANKIESFVFDFDPYENPGINDISWYENVVKETAHFLLDGNYKHIVDNLNRIIEQNICNEDKQKYCSIAKDLLEKINDFDIKNENRSKGYRLYEAVKFGTAKEVQQSINDGADVNFIYEPYFYGYTPLHMAAYNGDEEKIKLLLAKGANINALSILGRTPLSLAQERHNIESVIDLLNIYGASDGLMPMPDFAKVGEVFYTHDDKFLLIAESGKIMTFDRLPTAEILEVRATLEFTEDSIKIDFSDNDYYAEAVYYAFSFDEYIKNIEAENSFTKKGLPYKVDTKEYPEYQLTLLTEDEAIYVNPGDEVLVVDIKEGCLLSEEDGYTRYFNTMNQVINLQKEIFLGARYVAFCERSKGFMENLNKHCPIKENECARHRKGR